MAEPSPTAGTCNTEQFYEQRYREGYMEEWPTAKKQRAAWMLSRLTLPAQGVAVDFGCGNGVFTQVLREQLPGWRILGLDISETAIRHACQRVSGCEFHLLQSPTATEIRADLVFTHHVLEHVEDLGQTWRQLCSLASVRAWMVHVLPCGNPGSLEQRLCAWRRDGVDPHRGGRQFFEDPGHVRRLTSAAVVQLAAEQGFTLHHAAYSHHFWESIAWISECGPRFVWHVANPLAARNLPDSLRLGFLAACLTPPAICSALARRLPGPLRRLANLPHQALLSLADYEWLTRHDDAAGAEMYLAFERPDAHA